jgi:hypothetical protein
MQALGLSDSTPRTESRLKNLFWPSVQTADDVDYLGTLGYWFCALAGVFSLAVLILQGHPISATIVFLFYYLGGVGVREHSRYAATVVFLLYAMDMLFVGFSVPRILISALLLSNLRATWIAAGWKPDSEEAIQPPRFNETFKDKLVDQFPMWLWPKVRILYYIFSSCLLLVTLLGTVAMIIQRAGRT